MKYKAYRIVDGKPKWVIVDENGKIINKNPSKEELKPLVEKDGRSKPRRKRYTDKELLDYLIQFFEENGRVPIIDDFTNNPEYPNFTTYQRRFESWNNSLKLDIDTTVKQGVLLDTITSVDYLKFL